MCSLRPPCLGIPQQWVCLTPARCCSRAFTDTGGKLFRVCRCSFCASSSLLPRPPPLPHPASACFPPARPLLTNGPSCPSLSPSFSSSVPILSLHLCLARCWVSDFSHWPLCPVVEIVLTRAGPPLPWHWPPLLWGGVLTVTDFQDHPGK
jgi:hypothetical protein